MRGERDKVGRGHERGKGQKRGEKRKIEGGGGKT